MSHRPPRQSSRWLENRMESVVEDFLERDLVTPDVRRQAERLLARNESAEALELILDHRD
ncbi:hypothetical protein OB905_02610 [Halobacteria archaeon AArc-dxtr1]|nr:hypothetical protein [Halobacteria archaeon AArc-dxtr1]